MLTPTAQTAPASAPAPRARGPATGRVQRRPAAPRPRQQRIPPMADPTRVVPQAAAPMLSPTRSGILLHEGHNEMAPSSAPPARCVADARKQRKPAASRSRQQRNPPTANSTRAVAQRTVPTPSPLRNGPLPRQGPYTIAYSSWTAPRIASPMPAIAKLASISPAPSLVPNVHPDQQGYGSIAPPLLAQSRLGYAHHSAQGYWPQPYTGQPVPQPSPFGNGHLPAQG